VYERFPTPEDPSLVDLGVPTITLLTVFAGIGTLITAAEFCYQGFAGDYQAQGQWGVALAICAGATRLGMAALRNHPDSREWWLLESPPTPPGAE